MKKFCFVLLDSINRTPYIRKYIDACEFHYDIILWDRMHNSDASGADNCYYFKTEKLSSGLKEKAQKARAYLQFSRYIKNVLAKNDYDGVFVFAANTACLCASTLLKSYKGRYILDFRDYWQEKHKLLYNIEKKLLRYCYTAVISSRAYETFLPPYKYVMSHNSQFLDEKQIEHFRNRETNKDRLVLACIGGVKYPEYDRQVIDYFANDPRFELRYIGRGYDVLTDYCNEKRYKNVVTSGEFLISETMGKYEGVDVILNMYGNHTPKLDYALSNKLYFSAQLGMPILVCPDTYMADMVTKHGTGFVVDIQNPSDKDKIYEQYMKTNWGDFYHHCDSFLDEIRNDEMKFRDMVRNFTAE